MSELSFVVVVVDCPENKVSELSFGHKSTLVAPKYFTKFWLLLKLITWQEVSGLRSGLRWSSAGLG